MGQLYQLKKLDHGRPARKRLTTPSFVLIELRDEQRGSEYDEGNHSFYLSSKKLQEMQGAPELFKNEPLFQNFILNTGPAFPAYQTPLPLIWILVPQNFWQQKSPGKLLKSGKREVFREKLDQKIKMQEISI